MTAITQPLRWLAATVKALGAGLTNTGGTLAASGGGGGTVTTVVSGAGMHAGTITTAGTLLADWNGGTVTTIGANLALVGGTLASSGGSGGTVTQVVAGAGMHAGTITTSGTLLTDWNAGTVTTIGANLSLTSGTLAASSGSSGLIMNTQTASYALLASDVNKQVIFNSNSAVVATFPTLGSLVAGNVFSISNVNTGVVSCVTGSSNGTIDAGGTAFSLATAQFATVTNNGTNWATRRGQGAQTIGAAGGMGFGPGNTIGITNAGMAFGAGNTANTGGIASGDTNSATAARSIAIGNANTASANGSFAFGSGNIVSVQTAYAIGTGNTLTAGNPYAFGQNNQASGAINFLFGQLNIATGANSSFLSGIRVTDRGNTLGWYQGVSGFNGSTVPFQGEQHYLSANNTGTIASVLTSNLSAAGAANIANLGTRMTGFVSGIDLVITDVTNHNGNSYSLSVPSILNKGTSNATTTFGSGTFVAGPTIGTGLTLAAGPTIAADTTNGGFSIGFTPPVANTATIRATAIIRMMTQGS